MNASAKVFEEAAVEEMQAFKDAGMNKKEIKADMDVNTEALEVSYHACCSKLHH